MSVKREALMLIGWVLAVDAVFIAGYFLAHVQRSAPGAKLAFTVVWTLVTLVVVVRGLARIRSARHFR